jgi:hypothetical protein
MKDKKHVCYEAFPEPVNTYVDELRQFDHLPKRIHPEIPPDIPLKQSFYIEDYWPGSVLNSAYPKAIVFPETPPRKTRHANPYRGCLPSRRTSPPCRTELAGSFALGF